MIAITEPDLGNSCRWLKVLPIGHHGSDRLWFLLTAVVESYNSSISDFFFSCLRFSTLVKMVLRSQCLLFTRKELNWMVLILPSCMDMEASTYQLHQATGKHGNLYVLLKYLVLTAVTDWGHSGLWIWHSNAFQVPKKQDGGRKDCTVQASLVCFVSSEFKGFAQGHGRNLCQSREVLCSSEVYSRHPALWIIP